MRIHLSLSKPQKSIPFDHQPSLVGAIHKWLGENEIHGRTSLHSFSSLVGGKKSGEGLIFPYSPKWFISAHNNEVIKTIIRGIQIDPIINFGLEVIEVVIQDNPILGNMEKFSVASPVFIKRRIGESVKHFTFEDADSDIHLTETLITKLNKAGLNSENIEVCFDRSYSRPLTKLINYNGIKNRASICPVIVRGSPEQVLFAWNVGVGNSTGIGFGALN